VTDAQLIAAFENGRPTSEGFHHADHVRLAFLYLGRFPALTALRRFSEALGRFAAVGGRPNLYHETITWSFLLLIRERIERRLRDTGRRPSWDEFAAANSELLCWKEHILKKYYRDETLASDLARSTFILPDRGLHGSSDELSHTHEREPDSSPHEPV
jgi:hypothetical protein